ncbi:hypothetical protein IWQ61_005343 [Dispira simplex]|nr:hypothetical protein IWQ61_005343 [Dispira simplex]
MGTAHRSATATHHQKVDPPSSNQTLTSYRVVTDMVRQILSKPDSRQIFYFLLLNLSYMVVQLAYGVWSNSLSLVSDAVHMFFDSLALGIGLVASLISQWPAKDHYTWGYGSVEVLSGFTNGILLIFISLSIVAEALQRLWHPSHVHTQELLWVSIGGLAVNLVGIFAFNHQHVHAHGSCHHDHHHDSHGHDHSNANMQGVFLHIVADTLGSVGVIISTLLIRWFEWPGFDPLASILIATFIFLSVIPLVKLSAQQLLLPLPRASVRRDQIHEALVAVQRRHQDQVRFHLQSVRCWAPNDRTMDCALHLMYSVPQPTSNQCLPSHGLLLRDVQASVHRCVPSLRSLCVQLEPAKVDF